MIKKFFLGFVIILGYFSLPFLVTNVLEDSLTTEYLVGMVLAFVIGFFPLMFFLSNKLFMFKALHQNPLSEDKLVEKIKQLNLKNCKLTAEHHDDFLVLTSPYMNADFISLTQSQNIQQTYYMKLWFDDSKHLVRFKDHLVSSSSLIGCNNFSFSVSSQSGYVSTATYLMDSTGNLVRFSNAELHRELIKVVTENGWDLKLKLI
ncbi:hypothetical protein HUO09_07315 [Vibrio sp. Y2-5]|uniref:hypothetical protein n=1 Tax=Vibrio TaxID=662 RepID=UPI00142DC805|nr:MULTISPECIES: hypothetical protein [Vibrio]MBD0786148.1 hypothetical protein [Vibrio sp. Y2-5]NIY90692.1 hypothetical protein [Vibrio diazotrophicus]